MGNSNDRNTIAGNNIQHSNVNIGDGARQVIQPAPQSEQEVSYPAFSPLSLLSPDASVDFPPVRQQNGARARLAWNIPGVR